MSEQPAHLDIPALCGELAGALHGWHLLYASGLFDELSEPVRRMVDTQAERTQAAFRKYKIVAGYVEEAQP